MDPPSLEFELLLLLHSCTYYFWGEHMYPFLLRVPRSRIDGLRGMHMCELTDQFPKQLYQFTLKRDF